MKLYHLIELNQQEHLFWTLTFVTSVVFTWRTYSNFIWTLQQFVFSLIYPRQRIGHYYYYTLVVVFISIVKLIIHIHMQLVVWTPNILNIEQACNISKINMLVSSRNTCILSFRYNNIDTIILLPLFPLFNPFIR